LRTFRVARVLPRDAARASIGRWAVCLYYWALAPAGLPGTLAPELDPDPELEPEPMFGQCFPDGPPPFGGGVPVFAPGAGVVGLGVVGALVEPDAAAAETPPSAPPLAIAPATIVAPSSFALFMRSNLHLWVEGWCRSMVHRVHKPSQRPV
jgi:hypothetical protein